MMQRRRRSAIGHTTPRRSGELQAITDEYSNDMDIISIHSARIKSDRQFKKPQFENINIELDVR